MINSRNLIYTNILDLTEASQETNFKNKVDKWNQTVKAQHQAKKDDQTTDDEEENLQDNIDQELESRHKKMLG